MRFRTGLLVGLAVGYYLGARAGRERYEQLERWLDLVRSTDTVRQARTRLADGIREGTTAARRLIEDVALSDGRTGTDELVGDPTFN